MWLSTYKRVYAVKNERKVKRRKKRMILIKLNYNVTFDLYRFYAIKKGWMKK